MRPAFTILDKQLIFLFCFYLAQLMPALAENIEIYELEFPVQSIEKSSTGIATINVSGTEETIPISAINSRVVSLFFENAHDSTQLSERISLFPINRLKRFLELALTDKNISLAAYGLAALIMHPESSTSLIDEIVWKTETLNSIREVLPDTLKIVKSFQSEQGVEFPILVLQATLSREQSTLAKDPSLSNFRKSKFTEYLEQRYIKNLILGNANISQNILDPFSFLYSEKPTYYNKLQSLHEVIPQIIEDFRSGKEGNILTLRELTTGDPKLQAAIIPAYNEFIHRTAEQYLTGQDYGSALWVLSKIIFETRTPLTHELVYKCLASLKAHNSSPLLRTGVASFLTMLSLKDGSIKALYQQRLAEQIQQLLKNQQPQRVDIFFGLLLSISPDPALLNDQLRLARADYYQDHGDTQATIAMLESLSGALPGLQKTWVALRIAWLRSPILSIIGFVLALLLILVLSKQTIQIIREEGKENEEKEDVYHPDNRTFVDEELPIFVQGGSHAQLSPIAHEYICLLNVLNLSAGATIQDIKRAYRAEIKKLHPDLAKKNQRQVDTEAIMKLKATYHRLMEMEKTKLISKEEKETLKRRLERMQSW